MLFGVCGSLRITRCSLFGCSLLVVCRSLVAFCCSLIVVCYLSFGILRVAFGGKRLALFLALGVYWCLRWCSLCGACCVFGVLWSVVLCVFVIV